MSATTTILISSRFSYEPLPPVSSSIRLAILEPGERNFPIKVTLQQTAFDLRLRYKAMSYHTRGDLQTARGHSPGWIHHLSRHKRIGRVCCAFSFNLSLVCAQPYWNRVWIFQEVGAAGDLVVRWECARVDPAHPPGKGFGMKCDGTTIQLDVDLHTFR